MNRLSISKSCLLVKKKVWARFLFFLAYGLNGETAHYEWEPYGYLLSSWALLKAAERCFEALKWQLLQVELSIFHAANNTGSCCFQEPQWFCWALFYSGAPPMSALTLEIKKVSARCSNDHRLDVLFRWCCLCWLQSTGIIFSFFLLLVIGPPANPAALNLASAAIAIVVSYTQFTEEFCDRRGISSHLWGWDGWPHQPLLGGRCASEPLTMCLTASTRAPTLSSISQYFNRLSDQAPSLPREI